MWVKATTANGNTIYFNLERVKLLRPASDGVGATAIFDEGDEIALQEPPEQLLSGQDVSDAQPPKQMTTEARAEARRLSRL